jgi:hypothetical protein
MTADPVDADAIAIEHLLWAREQGCSPADVLASVGVGWPCRRPPRWDDAQFALAIRWRRLRRKASQTGNGEKQPACCHNVPITIDSEDRCKGERPS